MAGFSNRLLRVLILLIVVITLCLFSKQCHCTAHLHFGAKHSCLDDDNGACNESPEAALLHEMKFPATGLRPGSQTHGLRAKLVHRDWFTQAAFNLTKAERLWQAIQRSNKRQRRLQESIKGDSRGSNARNDMYSPVHAGESEFLMQLGIGYPVVTYTVIVDTGSDLIWTQCQPCTNCYDQTDQIYNPSESMTYRNASCNGHFCRALPGSACNNNNLCEYFYEYGDTSFTTGFLGFETFSLMTVNGNGQTFLPNVAFGCGRDNEGLFSEAGGIVGLGRGPLSLVSQLGSMTGNYKFSYCLVSLDDDASQSSPLIIGNSANLHVPGVQSTPFIRNPFNPTFYYVRIVGISVHGTALSIPRGTFDIRADGGGGMIIDSGTTLTYLPEAAYNPLQSAVRSYVGAEPVDGSAVGLSLCFDYMSADLRLPRITFNFAGGARYTLPPKNSFVLVEDDGDEMVCLAFSTSSDLAILVNIQQQNFHILYDLDKNRLSFVPTICDAL